MGEHDPVRGRAVTRYEYEGGYDTVPRFIATIEVMGASWEDAEELIRRIERLLGTSVAP